MFNDVIDRISDAIDGADTGDWIVAVIVGALAWFIVVRLLRLFGCFFRTVSLLLASVIAIVVVLIVLDRRGVPRSIGGEQIDHWIDDARQFIGV